MRELSKKGKSGTTDDVPFLLNPRESDIKSHVIGSPIFLIFPPTDEPLFYSNKFQSIKFEKVFKWPHFIGLGG